MKRTENPKGSAANLKLYEKRPFPRWILLVMLAVVVIGGLAIALLNQDEPEEGQTAVPPA